MGRWYAGVVFAAMAWLMALGAPALAQVGGAAPAPLSASGAAPSPVDLNYRLGPGDKLRIIVFGETALSGEFFVSGGGAVAFPLIGDVSVAGSTIPEVQAAISSKLAAGYLKNPKVSAEVLNYRPFYILGEVMKPGEYPYTNGLTVMNAVATAQGFTYRADTKKVFVKRASTTAEQQVPLNAATAVLPGDTIRIGERFF